MLKEKLIFSFWKKLNDENKEILGDKDSVNQIDSSEDLDANNSFDSTNVSSNTPRGSKNLGLTSSVSTILKQNEIENNPIVPSAYGATTGFALPHPNVIYKYFIGKGNNSIMVRSLFKNRYWWVQCDSMENDKINFTWTQTKV